MAPRIRSLGLPGIPLLVSVVAVAVGAACGPETARRTAGMDRHDQAPSGDTPAEIFVRVPDGVSVSDGGPSRGVAWGDANADGLPDLAVANDGGWPLWLYRNRGGGTFEQEVGGWPLTVGGFSQGVAWIDYDDDGDLDLHLTDWGTRGYPLHEGPTYRPTSLFRNDGGEAEILPDLVPVAAGDLTTDPVPAVQACWADYDVDGDLDVFLAVRDGVDDALYENRGDGTFRRLRRGPWVGRGGPARTCGAGDADGDGLPEIYVGNFLGEDNALYRNRGDLRFEEVQEGPLVESGARTYGISWVDFDDDGDLDVFVTNIASEDRNLLFENDGDGNFTVRDDLTVVRDSRGPSKGHTWGDYDNDGDLDLYVANGTMGTEEVPDFGLRNFLYLNRGDGTFRRVDGGCASTDAQVSAGVAWADYDGDGDLDLLVANWGGGAEERKNTLCRNITSERTDRRWIVFRLEGTVSNRFGLGAEIRVLARVADETRWQTRWLTSGTGYASQNEPIVHFGLGAAARVDSVVVRWPSGLVSRFADLHPNQVIRVREGG